MIIATPFINRTLLGIFLLLLLIPGTSFGANSLPGDYHLLDEPAIQEPGKVVLLEFADFYCPHCHLFEQTVAAKLENEFGERLEVRMVGFPVIRGKLPTAFEMYEQAKMMGRGPEMRTLLFHSIHQEGIQIFDKGLRRLLIREAGLDVNEFEKGMASGEPYKAVEKGKVWGERIGVTHTPTIVLNGNIRVDNLDIENIRTVINGLLKTQ